jgi:hypothetical protein
MGIPQRHLAIPESLTALPSDEGAAVDLPVRVVVTPGKGRGVVATRRIHEGERFDRAHVLVVEADQVPHVERTVLDFYVYAWNDERLAVALGVGSLYNHSYRPSARYLKRFDDVVIDYVALRDIEAGEEITINYNGRPDDQTPMWFDGVKD